MRKFTTLMLALVMAALFAVPAVAKDKVKVGFIYVSPIGDAGYSYAHNEGRLAVDMQPWAETSYVESVAEGPDSERVMQNMARKGYDLIIGTSFGYMDPMVKVSKKFPKTAFMHCSGFKTTENMGNFFGRMYQARYLTGLTAGKMTKADKIGYVAAFPIPEVIRGINAFTQGVKKVNPDAEVRVVWTKTWYDPALEKDAAKSLLDVGCDVIAQHQDSPGPQEAAEEAGVYSVGYNTDMAQFAPKAQLTAAVWHWGPLYVEFAKQVKDGTWKPESLWPGMEKEVIDIADFGPMVPEDVQAMVEKERDALRAGNDNVFAGPIKDQDGNIKVKAGEKLSDKDMLGMTWFVDGVVGTVK